MDDGRVPIPGGSDACPRCPCWFLSCRAMPRLEEITYEAGRSALADQESLVSGIRQRTVVGLAVAASILAPWRFKFAVDSRELYIELYERAAAEAEADTLGWLASAGYGYQELRERNASRVGLMSTLSGALGLLMVLQTLAWLAALAVD
jgi:hypothetical protein